MIIKAYKDKENAEQNLEKRNQYQHHMKESQKGRSIIHTKIKYNEKTR